MKPPVPDGDDQPVDVPLWRNIRMRVLALVAGFVALLVLRLKPAVPDSDDHPADATPVVGSKGRNSRKHALALVAGFVALFFVAAVQQGDPATGKVSITTLVAVLKDPLSLFAERSPGGRGEGALLPTKERVLSTVRERDPAGTLPGVGDPVVAGVPEAAAPGDAGGPAPEERVLSGERGGLPGGGGGGAPGGFGGGPGGFAPFAGAPGGLIPENFATAPPQVDGDPAPGPDGPGNPGIPGTPPGLLDPGPGPDGPGNPGIPGIPPGGGSPVPEPATWAMMLLGFFVIGAAIRRRTRHACTQ